MKKQLQSKERAILEKDKKVCMTLILIYIDLLRVSVISQSFDLMVRDGGKIGSGGGQIHSPEVFSPRVRNLYKKLVL